MTNSLLGVSLTLAAAPVVLASGYLLLLTMLSARPAPQVPAPPHLRFDVVVPAHDEEGGIAETVRSIRAVDYPEFLRRVVVVADNCTDDTAARARRAGAIVLVRDDATLRGKGYALRHAFEWSLASGFADAVVVVDADTSVSPNLLVAFAARLERGATAVQADNGVGNPEASWRTCLMSIAFSLVGTLRMLGRERLRCSTGLRGNGMCLSARVLREVPHEAFSVVEDLEYGIHLGLHGHRVAFAQEGWVRSEMASGSAVSGVQRQRWEGGRFALARHHALGLIGRGLRRRDRVLLDLGMDLAVPPLGYLAGLTVAGAAISAAATFGLGVSPLALLPWIASLAGLVVYVARGWWLSGTGLRGLRALAFSPAYLAWKSWLLVRGRMNPGGRWDRTPRERGPP